MDNIESVWKNYRIGLQVTGELGGSLPRTTEEIKRLLEYRKPSRMPEDAVPIDELVEQVSKEVGATSKKDTGSEYVPNWSTFKRDSEGYFYYEGRQMRGHIKDCALQIAEMMKPDIKNFRSKVANKVYVVSDRIPLKKFDNVSKELERVKEPDGAEERFIQVMTRQGPRSAIKFIDYVKDPYIEFDIKILNDGIIKIEHIYTILDYGSVHGMGQERSQGWGRYRVNGITDISELPKRSI